MPSQVVQIIGDPNGVYVNRKLYGLGDLSAVAGSGSDAMTIVQGGSTVIISCTWQQVFNAAKQLYGTDRATTITALTAVFGTAPAGGVTSISVAAPLVKQGTTAVGLSISLANAANDGYITSASAVKLSGIETGAEVNVNADWNASSGDAQILNKPTIPSDIGDLTDVPASIGTSGQVLAVNGGGTALEYVNQSGGGAGTVTSVSGTAPIVSTGGNTPTLSINAATTGAAGSLSAADKTKLDGIDGNVLDGQIIEYTTRSAAFANGSFEGEVLKYGAGTLVETKAYVYGSSAWTAVDADNEAKTKGLFGIALGTSGFVSGLLVRGVMQHTSWSGFAIGEILYISTTEGLITNTAPSATGDFVRVIGYALGNSYIFVDASGTYIEIA